MIKKQKTTKKNCPRFGRHICVVCDCTCSLLRCFCEELLVYTRVVVVVVVVVVYVFCHCLKCCIWLVGWGSINSQLGSAFS